MPPFAHYDTPYHWWGPGPAPPQPLTLPDLLRHGAIDVEWAATLWAAMGQRRSLTVIGGPSGLGKSTLLHALLPSLPQDTRHAYLRGCYESFAFLRDQHYAPATTVLLINEISPHLPVYLWGPAVSRALTAGEAGYQILATAHGRSVTEFAASLTGSPLRIPARKLAALGLVAFLEPTGEAGRGRLTEVWQLSAARHGVSLDRLEPGEPAEGVTVEMVTTARDSVLSLLARGRAVSGTGQDEASDRLPTRSGSGLEQTPAGE